MLLPNGRKMLEKTMYMQGGGYILSRDLVARVAARAEEPPEYLPEDAIVARLLGQDVVDRCMCSDTRLIKEAYNFQAIDLLGNSTRLVALFSHARRSFRQNGAVPTAVPAGGVASCRYERLRGFGHCAPDAERARHPSFPRHAEVPQVGEMQAVRASKRPAVH